VCNISVVFFGAQCRSSRCNVHLMVLQFLSAFVYLSLQNIELKVEVESLKKELLDKQELLKKAW